MQISDLTSRQRVATAVRKRREELRLRQEDVTSRGGPSKAWQYGVESASTDSLSDVAVTRLERALQWEEGSVADVVAGLNPRPKKPATGADSESESGVEPVTLEYKGYKVVIYPNPDASPEEVARAQDSVLNAAMERLRQLGLDGTE
jgi:hypothetical protein